MTFGSACSGIEAASCAWHPLGWRPAFFAEIDRLNYAKRDLTQQQFAELCSDVMRWLGERIATVEHILESA